MTYTVTFYKKYTLLKSDKSGEIVALTDQLLGLYFLQSLYNAE